MWVRSQDYKRLVNVNEFGIYGDDFIGYSIESNDIFLGTYSTEKTALEVLDIIEDCIVGNINCVFQMPLDSEVEE